MRRPPMNDNDLSEAPGEFVGPRPGHGPGPRDHEPPTLTFTFSEDLTTVTGATATFGEHSRDLDVSLATFTTTVGTNDLGEEAVVEVTDTRTTDDCELTRLFDDQDGDGSFTPLLDVRVATTDEHLMSHQFTFDSNGAVTAEQVLARDGETWHDDPITANEVFETVDLDGLTYVVETESHGDAYSFKVSRDDNGDDVWSTIAVGHADASYVDTTTGAFDLTAIQTFLAASSSVMG